jgi:RecA-family ATPase
MKSAYLVDTILPCGEIHLVGGPTGAGKTRWLFDTLLDWQAGRSVLGYRSHPCRWAYVSCDRRDASVYRTLETMGIDPKDIPLVGGMSRKLTLSQILDEVQKMAAKLVVIEAFGGFVDPPNSVTVRNFFYSFQDILEKTGMTIIGVVESPKMKPKERYANPRQRISGAAAWGHYAETIVLVEPKTPEIPNSPRVVTVCPRNASEIRFDAMFEGGRLVPVIPSKHPDLTKIGEL